jgi:hypothetical protein
MIIHITSGCGCSAAPAGAPPAHSRQPCSGLPFAAARAGAYGSHGRRRTVQAFSASSGSGVGLDTKASAPEASGQAAEALAAWADSVGVHSPKLRMDCFDGAAPPEYPNPTLHDAFASSCPARASITTARVTYECVRCRWWIPRFATSVLWGFRKGSAAWRRGSQCSRGTAWWRCRGNPRCWRPRGSGAPSPTGSTPASGTAAPGARPTLEHRTPPALH